MQNLKIHAHKIYLTKNYLTKTLNLRIEALFTRATIAISQMILLTQLKALTLANFVNKEIYQQLVLK